MNYIIFVRLNSEFIFILRFSILLKNEQPLQNHKPYLP